MGVPAVERRVQTALLERARTCWLDYPLSFRVLTGARGATLGLVFP